jgi:hypothetical protein
VAIGDVIPVKLAPDGQALVIDQAPLVRGALVAIEPSTGRIRALVGGYDWRDNKFDRASQGRRQVGSSIKPFIYGSALAAGYTVVDRVLDGPVACRPPACGCRQLRQSLQRLGHAAHRAGQVFNTISVRRCSTRRSGDRVMRFASTATSRHISIARHPDITLLEMVGAMPASPPASTGHAAFGTSSWTGAASRCSITATIPPAPRCSRPRSTTR